MKKKSKIKIKIWYIYIITKFTKCQQFTLNA